MADNGKLYSGFTAEHVEAMRKTHSKADVIYPNITEACLFNRYALSFWKITMDFTRELAKKLAELGPEYIIITDALTAKSSQAFNLY